MGAASARRTAPATPVPAAAIHPRRVQRVRSSRVVMTRHVTSEGGGWRLEVGGWRLEVGGWRLEVGGWRLEAGGWRLEAGGWRLEAGGWRLGGGWDRDLQRK